MQYGLPWIKLKLTIPARQSETRFRETAGILGWAPWHHHLRDFHLSTPGEVSMIQMLVNLWLVVEPTHLKNMLVKLGIFPK